MASINKVNYGLKVTETHHALTTEVSCNGKCTVTYGRLIPANVQFIALNKASKYAILPAKGECIVVTYVLLRNERVAPHHHVWLTKNAFPIAAFARYPVRKRLTKEGPDPMGEDPDMKDLRKCAEEVVHKTSSSSARPPEVREQRERDGHMPKLPDCPVCVEDMDLW